MELALMDLQGVDKINKTLDYKRHKLELENIQNKFNLYESVIKRNKQNGIIPIDDKQMRIQQAEQKLEQNNFQLIQIKQDAYQAEKYGISAQHNLNNQGAILDRALGANQDMQQNLNSANQNIIEIQQKRRKNKIILWTAIGSVIFAFAFIIMYRLYKIFG
ncbi:hypothetical protein PPERSA_08441 [Pseudocohnilembus persalinus]|uniref:Uncharacterized protein n=1 Tax=Pseudocohnilembus persalinus TaxID=266149 RepID=A0A0V0R6A6_PSEPJ|nr:hypothetical protein PPERSA_08441 [Pseudocohnilembus persalinus]|eukprot:KRX10038.1 hypothetical protein PPERSA_08441 [Pseudocohnilembus persalinus]